MTTEHVRTINSLSFTTCVASILLGIAIASLGIWGLIPTAGGLLWRALGTCGLLFAGSICSSLAIRCFKTNE
jgi:hypothetical protein